MDPMAKGLAEQTSVSGVHLSSAGLEPASKTKQNLRAQSSQDSGSSTDSGKVFVNGSFQSRLQYLRAMAQIKGAAKKIEKEEKQLVMKRLSDFFQTSDHDGDGQLTITELTRSLRRFGYNGSDAEIKKFFRLADVSDDQLISKEEFVAVMMRAPALVHREMTMRRVFTKFDKDGNGSIDKDELKMVFEELGKLMPEEEITRMMKMADQDDSGTMEYEEFIEIVMGKRKRLSVDSD